MSSIISEAISTAEAIKAEGNDAFQTGNLDDAMQKYKLALERISKYCETPHTDDRDMDNNNYKIIILKATIVSNLAMCLLKQVDGSEVLESETIHSIFQIISDIDTAVKSLDNLGSCPTESSNVRKAVRSKLLYRRSKARFLLAIHRESVQNHLNMTHSQWIQLFTGAQSDLQELLSFDPKNKEAVAFLLQVKVKAAEMLKDKGIYDSSPLSSALVNLEEAMREAAHTLVDPKRYDSIVENLKFIQAALLDDISSRIHDLLRNDAKGGKILLAIALGIDPIRGTFDRTEEDNLVQTLAMQCVTSACTRPSFSDWLLQHMEETGMEGQVSRIVEDCRSQDGVVDFLNAIATLYMRLTLYKHVREDDDNYLQYQTQEEDEQEDNNSKDESTMQHSIHMPTTQQICRICCVLLQSKHEKCKFMATNLLSVWLEHNPLNIIHNLGENDEKAVVYSLVKEPTEDEIRKMAPRQLAEYRKRVSIRNRKRKKRSRMNTIYFCKYGGLDELIASAIHAQEAFWRRESIIQIGRLMSSICEEGNTHNDGEIQVDEEAQRIVCSIISQEESNANIIEVSDIEGFCDDSQDGQLNTYMKNCLFATGVLIGDRNLGVWTINKVWKHAANEWHYLASSENTIAMSIAAEFASAGASEKETRSWISSSVDLAEKDGIWRKLLYCKDHEIQSGAASALAKLGLSNKSLSSDEGEIISLLEIASGLLSESYLEGKDEETSKLTEKYNASIERGVELLSYLATKTFVKNELIHGFGVSIQSSQSDVSTLEKLVKISQSKTTTSSITYALANIFASLSVSVETLRNEAFEGQEITPEQYDDLQAIGKTEEERKLEESKREVDCPDAVSSRIKVMALKNVPRALVNLLPDSTEGTLEQIVTSFARMACERTVRGSMIQQGCLSACINISTGGDLSKTYKKIVRLAQHTIAKLLVTTNPALLNTSQCMGSILPLLMLVKDHDSSDLQKFESLLSLTNLASLNENAKDHIVEENGISVLSYAMFSNHEMVRRAATEAMSNLIPNPKIFEHLRSKDNLKVWVAFASDFENNFESARAALGCLAMITQDSVVANQLTMVENTEFMIKAVLECGQLELMHRILVLVLNLNEHGGRCKDFIISTGAVAFCEVYIASYQNDKHKDLGFSDADSKLMTVTLDLAREIVSVQKSS